MSRYCDQCGKRLTIQRADARFCDERCRARWHYRNAPTSADTAKRIMPARESQDGSRSGSRGGALPPLSLSDVQTLFDTWRSREYGWVRAHILLHAAEAGEFHADDTAAWELAQPNVIGAAVNALAKGGLLEKLNRHGEPEHRPGSSSASHGRASYVWRATERGKTVARDLWHQREAGIGFFKNNWAALEDEMRATIADDRRDWERRASGQLFPLPPRSAVTDPEAA